MESIFLTDSKIKYKCLTFGKRLTDSITNFLVIKFKDGNGEIKAKTYCDYACMGFGYKNLSCVLCGKDCHLTICDKIINMEEYVNILKLCSPTCSRAIVTLTRKKDGRTLEASCKACKKYVKDLKRCGKCGMVYYCSKECQIKDWKDHKEDCKLITMNE